MNSHLMVNFYGIIQSLSKITTDDFRISLLLSGVTLMVPGIEDPPSGIKCFHSGIPISLPGSFLMLSGAVPLSFGMRLCCPGRSSSLSGIFYFYAGMRLRSTRIKLVPPRMKLRKAETVLLPSGITRLPVYSTSEESPVFSDSSTVIPANYSNTYTIN